MHRVGTNLTRKLFHSQESQIIMFDLLKDTRSKGRESPFRCMIRMDDAMDLAVSKLKKLLDCDTHCRQYLVTFYSQHLLSIAIAAHNLFT